ncbi:uncharacterized protein isoform X2 [Rhodnius prolixus]|uniref:uncharacterized protein isoform X2 n=1 Tax=Rhodnius prolixus TaxID=13249 RepID=UPI003D18B95D
MSSATSTLHWCVLLLVVWEVAGETTTTDCVGNATSSCIHHKVNLALQKITQIPEIKLSKWFSVVPCGNCIGSKDLVEKLSRTSDEIDVWSVLEKAVNTFIETRSLRVILPDWIKPTDGALDIELGQAFQGRRRGGGGGGGKKGNNLSMMMMGIMGKVALMTMLMVKIKAMKALMIAIVALLMSKMQLFKMMSPTAGRGGDGGAAHVIVLKESGGGGGGGGGHGGNGGGHSGGTVHVVHETFPSSGAWNADSGNVGANSWGAAGGAWNTGGSAPAGHGSASWGRRSQDSSKVLLNTSK